MAFSHDLSQRKMVYPDMPLRHLVTMTSGYDAVGKSRWNEESEDWSKTSFQISEPLFEPGTAYAYWDEAMIMLGRVLMSAAGENLQDYFDRKVGGNYGTGKLGVVVGRAV